MHLIVLKLDDKNLEDFCKKMREAPLKLEAFRDEVGSKRNTHIHDLPL